MNKIKFLSITLFTLLIATMTSQESHAQTERRFGVKGGLNVSNLYVDDVTDENARFGFNAGLYGQVFSTEGFALQPELLYSTKGSKVEYGSPFDQTVKYNLAYLDLPVLAVIKLGDAAEIHLGPYVSYLLSSNIKYEGTFSGSDEIDRDNLKTYDFGLVGGFGLNFGAVQVGARYNYGLVELADSDIAEAALGDSKNSNAQLYLAFNLNHGNE